MKKWMMYVLIGACTAGVAVAEDSVPWYKKMFNKSAEEETQVIPQAPAVTPVPAPAPDVQRSEGQRPQLTPEQKEKMKARAAQIQQREGASEKLRPQVNPEQAAKMKAQREEILKLGEAARNETDPVKKEALIGQLRAKLTESADKMQAEMKKRLDQAEKELPKLKERLADAEKNKTARIEEQLQKILAGEPLKGPEGKRPGPSVEGKHKKGPPAAAE